jgi:acyl carrier protein
MMKVASSQGRLDLVLVGFRSLARQAATKSSHGQKQMDPNREQIIAVIYASIDELNAFRGNNHGLKKSLQTVILKDGEGLDSLGFVNLVSLIEQKCEEQFGKSLALTPTDRWFGSSTGPFETVETLLEYVETVLKA